MKKVVFLFSVLLLFVIALTACQNKSKKLNVQALNNVNSEGIITVDGIDLHYKIEGTGTPIIVTNGSILRPTLSEKLREQCQLIFVDTRSFIPIETPSNLDSWTMDTYVDDIETIRKALKLEKVGVLSHSGFGFLPLEYAIKYPDNITYAIVIATPPFIFNNKYTEEEDKYWETLASEERKSAFLQKFHVSWFNSYFRPISKKSSHFATFLFTFLTGDGYYPLSDFLSGFSFRGAAVVPVSHGLKL